MPTGSFDILVLTEAVPRYGDLIQETYQYADSFFVYANNYNPNIKVFLYEDWHCILSGTPTNCDYDVDSNPWRQRLDDDLSMWESVVDSLNARFAPTNPVCLIPAAQGLAQVYDSIYVGAMPGLSDIEDLFSDNIHLNDIGKYFIACVHFATIFETSPVGLTNQLKVWWGGGVEAPSPELALKFQEIAWMTANTYPRSCLSTITSIENPKPVEEIMRLENFPNAFSAVTTINFQTSISGNTKLILSDALGSKVKTLLDEYKPKGSYNIQFDKEDLAPGIYYYQLKVGTYSLTKKMLLID